MNNLVYNTVSSSGMRFLPVPVIPEIFNDKKHKKHKKKHNFFILPEAPILNPYLPMNQIISPPLSPVVPVLSPMGAPVFNSTGSVLPGVYLTPRINAGVTGTTGAAGAAGTPGTTTPNSPVNTTLTYNVVTPPITNIRHLTHPDQDPQLRKNVVKHFYNRLKEVYFLSSKFKSLLKYIVVENNIARLVKTYEELQKNISNNSDYSTRVKFIIDNIFSKYDLEVLISKLIAKYGMLYSEDAYNMHWYNVKNKYSKKVTKAMYKKIKYRLQKKVHF